MDIAKLLSEHNVVTFILLFSRMSGMMAFFPLFSYNTIPMIVKTAIAFYLTILFFPMASNDLTLNSSTILLLMMLSEFALGLIAGLALNIVFGALGIAGMQISMVMGFSMATVFDPSSESNSPIISQFLTYLALLILLSFNGHHLMILFMSHAVSHLTLGHFYPHEFVWKYLSTAFKDMFTIGFILAFPIIALSLLSDLIFGMLMKTMPQFNMLVIGFPIKITLSVAIVIAVLASMMGLFKKEFIDVFYFLKNLYL